LTFRQAEGAQLGARLITRDFRFVVASCRNRLRAERSDAPPILFRHDQRALGFGNLHAGKHHKRRAGFHHVAEFRLAFQNLRFDARRHQYGRVGIGLHLAGGFQFIGDGPHCGLVQHDAGILDGFGI